MLPLRLELPKAFYEESTECGYTIKPEMKELWAVELDLLNELLKFCQEEDIKVYAAYGTLIGAVRHHGFIPWDNDIDVWMLREDYDRFLNKAKFSDPYFLQTEDTDIGFSRAFARLRNSETTCIQISEKDMNLSYNQGVFIDIFPIDYMAENIDERKAYGHEMRAIRDKAMKYSTFTFRASGGGTGRIKNKLKQFISKVSTPILGKLHKLNPYVVKMEQMARKYKDTNVIGDYWWYDPEKDKHCWNINEFQGVVYEQFESLQIPVPQGYDNVLSGSFGDWQTPVMENNDHGDLIFDAQLSYKDYLKGHMR